MAAWVVLYCQRSLADVTPEQVLAGIDDADWWTLAEDYGFEDEKVVNAAVKRLRIKELPGDDSGQYRWELQYRPRGRRQIGIERWTNPVLVADEMRTAREALARVRKPGARTVREHLARVRETVGIELGWDQLEDIAVVFAFEVARWLAHAGKGLIEDYNDEWWGLTRGGAYKRLLP
jgi:hypothetical protein